MAPRLVTGVPISVNCTAPSAVQPPPNVRSGRAAKADLLAL
jgi:hypothetical protein